MTSVPHEEVIMVNIGGLASSAVGSVHTTLSHAAGVLHLRNGLHVLSSLCLWLVPSKRRGWMVTFKNGIKSCGHILRS